ncbi:MAG: Zn-ribbon domain-containing OB-fold protein [Burkholderiaceae bacterium]
MPLAIELQQENNSRERKVPEALPQPIANPDSAPYWQGAREERLLIRQCQDCKAFHFMPRFLCPQCWSQNLCWVQATGNATVHSFTIIRRAPLESFTSRVPYVVALLDLEEGVRMMSNIVGDDALDTRIGDRVTVCFEDRGDGARIPQFQRAR